MARPVDARGPRPCSSRYELRDRIIAAVLSAPEALVRPRQPYTVEQFASAVADRLESFSEAVRKKNLETMDKTTRDVLAIYEDSHWHDAGQVAELLRIKTDTAGARRRDLKNIYGFEFESRVIGGV
jgi:hypothetical protein